MATLFQIGVFLALGLLGRILYRIAILPYYRHQLRFVPGPKRRSFILGDLVPIFQSAPGEVYTRWTNEYDGGVVRYGGFLGETRLLITDPVALNHVLESACYNYPKPGFITGELQRLLGPGILTAEGNPHKRQRKVILPAFGTERIKGYAPIMFEIGHVLKDQWTDLLTVAGEDNAAPKGAKLDVWPWISRAAMDTLGLAAFDYPFDTLRGKSSKLNGAFNDIFVKGAGSLSALFMFTSFLLQYLPFLGPLIPLERLKAIRNGWTATREEGHRMIQQRETLKGVDWEKGEGRARDVLSVLVKANADVEAKAKLTEEELIGNISTLMAAGRDTTASPIAWALYRLALSPDWQNKLREECISANGNSSADDRANFDRLAALRSLDAFVRETLRFYPSIPTTLRVALGRDEIPLSKPITLTNGQVVSSLPVEAGDGIAVSAVASNRSKAIWGEDGDEFKPERWIEGGMKKVDGPGIYFGTLTFLGGQRSCPGMRLAVQEIKIVLSILLSSFRFEPEAGVVIESRAATDLAPSVKGQPGNSMPLRVSLIQ